MTAKKKSIEIGNKSREEYVENREMLYKKTKNQ